MRYSRSEVDYDSIARYVNIFRGDHPKLFQRDWVLWIRNRSKEIWKSDSAFVIV
jgi:hypothetical protein